jgi:hypothetical protein
MRLRLLTIVGMLALALAVPSAALAHHGRGHHHHHKAKAQAKARHTRFRFEHVGSTGVSAPTSTPSTPTPPTPENAGKVTSYEKEVLTITLNDNSTVSGKVTADTHIRCISAMTPPSTEPGDQGQGDDNGQGDDQNRGDMNQGEQPGEGWGDHKDGGDDDGGPQSTPEPPCDTSLLVAGAVVRSAELRIGPSGNEFECIVLVRSS